MQNPIDIQPRDMADPNIVPFHADSSGVGDVFVLMWLAAGLSAAGKQPVFVADNPQRVDLIKSFGFPVISALQTGWKGFSTEHCLNAERVDRMSRPRHTVWAEMIPGNPLPKQPQWHGVKNPDAPHIMIFPHCNWKLREMPLGFWEKVATLCEENGDKVCFCVAETEVSSLEGQNFPFKVVVTKTWIDVVEAMAAHAKFVIGNDSGPMHAAMALGIPGAAAMITTKNVFTYTDTIAEIQVEDGVSPSKFVDAVLARQVCEVSSVHRIGIPEYAMRLAKIAALRSEDPFRKVGAVGLTEDNRVVALAYNGLAPGKNATPGFWEDRDSRRKYMIHAEQNLCSLVRRNEIRKVAVTTLPCESCASLLAAHGVREVFYSEEYAGDSMSVLQSHGVKCTRVSA